MDKAQTILAGDKGICLRYFQTTAGRWAASLVNRGTKLTIATGFGRRKEEAYQDLQGSIDKRASDFLAYCTAKVREGKNE